MEKEKNNLQLMWTLGVLFQLALIGLAQLIAYFFQKKNLLLALMPQNMPASIGLGLVIGFSMFGVVLLSYRHIPFLRAWSRNVVLPLLKNMEPRFLLAMGVLAGLSEELLFRGALQPVIGIVPASLLFGFVHYWGHKELVLYGIIATAMGFVMGAAFAYTGEILVPVVAHSVYNFLVLTALSKGLFD